MPQRDVKPNRREFSRIEIRVVTPVIEAAYAKKTGKAVCGCRALETKFINDERFRKRFRESNTMSINLAPIRNSSFSLRIQATLHTDLVVPVFMEIRFHVQ